MNKNGVLVVDDEELMRETVVEILTGSGMRAKGVSGGREALDELKKNLYCLVISDVMMAGMNGIELVRAVNERYPGLETIVMSGRGTEATRDKLNGIGVFGLLEKPVRATDLVSMAKKAAASDRRERLCLAGAGPELAFSRARILVADDDPAMLEVIKHSLALKGHNVTAVDNGEQAYEMFLINDYDMLVLDMNMPGMTGAETVQVIRETDPSTYILLISGESCKDEIEEAIDKGVDKFLAKPFTPSKLVATIDRVDFEKIRRRKKELAEKQKQDAWVHCGRLRRIVHPQAWAGFVKRHFFEYAAIILFGLVAGAFAVYLADRANEDKKPEWSINDTADKVLQYLDRDEKRELENRRH